MTPQLWLTQFLQARELPHPDGRMLYAYRLKEPEYAQLRELLAAWLGDKVMRSSGHLAPGVTELFVLYGAAWWQREYAGGPWRWDDVISSLGANPDYWSVAFRTTCVEVGLQYWKKKIGTSRKKYFVVLVEQGGLPRMLLSQSRGNIYVLIRTLLKRAARLGAEVDEIAAMVPDYKDKLPASLQKEEVHLLIAQVVGTVLDLKREFKLTNGENAVARLDRMEPEWRERFPLSLDDQAAVALLGDLVGEAAAIEAETRASPVMAERLLLQNGDVFSLISRIDFPKTIDAEALAGLANVDATTLPFRFSIDLQLEKRQLAADVRKVLGPGPARYQFAVQQSKWSGPAALCEHLLCIALPGQEPFNAPIPGGMELDPEAPWVFVAGGEECRLVAQGSARLRQDEAFLVVDNRWDVKPQDAHTQIERVGVFADVSLERSVFKVSGDVSVSDGAHLFRIRTRQPGAEAERPVWEGRRMGYASNPSLAFYGLPKLCRYTADGARAYVPASELEWRIAGTTRVIAPALARGPVDVLWRVDGEIRLRSRMVILERHAQLKFESGESVTIGWIHVPSLWAVDAVSGDNPGLSLGAERRPDWLSVQVSASGEPPESVRLTLDWKASPVPCRLTVPFPASGGRFFDRNETPLGENASITRDQLLGVRLRVLDSNPNHPVQHKIVFALQCSGERLAAPVRAIEHVLMLQENRAELRLIDYQVDVESLLSLTDALDAVVTVSLFAGRRKAASLQVKRYEFALVPDGSAVAVASNDLSRLTTSALSEIQLYAVPVESMHKDEAVALAQCQSEGVPTGRWELPAGSDDRPWLVYPAAGSSHNFRAVLVSQRGGPPPVPAGYAPAPESIHEVLLIGDPVRRRDILSRRLDALAKDYSHADWEIVEGVWSNLGHLTLPTLDIWRAFAMNPTALAAFACRNWPGNTLDDVMAMCDRFHSELGVLWETVPLSTWVTACSRLGDQLSDAIRQNVPQDQLAALVTAQVSATLRAIRMHFPALENLLAYVSFQQTGHDAEIVGPIMRTRINDLKIRLWSGEHAAIQTIILRDSADRPPPHLSLYDDLIANLKFPTDAMAKAVFDLLWDPTNPKAGVANMPVLLALCTCNRLLRDWWRDPKRLIQLRQYRDFDRDWFRHAFDQAVAMCLASGFVG